MNALIGFLIALAIGLTGIGGGSFTVPALVLIVGLPASASVGTAFVYAGVMRLIASPFYLGGKHIHWRYLVAADSGRGPRPADRHVSAAHIKRPVEHAGRRDPARPFAYHVVQRDVSPLGAEPELRAEEFGLAAVARASYRYRVRILFRWRGRARHRAAAELFRDVAAGSGRHGSAFRARPRRDRQRIPVEVRRDQRCMC